MDLNDDPSVMQVGLFSESHQEIENLVQRVSRFNVRWNTGIVLDIEPHDKGDAECPRPHAKIRLTFPSPEVQEKFWLE